MTNRQPHDPCRRALILLIPIAAAGEAQTATRAVQADFSEQPCSPCMHLSSRPTQLIFCTAKLVVLRLSFHWSLVVQFNNLWSCPLVFDINHSFLTAAIGNEIVDVWSDSLTLIEMEIREDPYHTIAARAS
jgi:hypothetical protein